MPSIPMTWEWAPEGVKCRTYWENIPGECSGTPVVLIRTMARGFEQPSEAKCLDCLGRRMKIIDARRDWYSALGQAVWAVLEAATGEALTKKREDK